MVKNYDIIIIGAGPAGMFAANELFNEKGLKILVIDERKRAGGAGAITDGKLNLSTKIGMDLDELRISEKYAECKIKYIDDIFLKHGADPTLSGTEDKKIEGWVEKAKKHKVELIPVKQRHMGSDVTVTIISKFRQNLEENGIEFYLDTKVEDIHFSESGFRIVSEKEDFKAKYLIVAPGRDGADWFRSLAERKGVKNNYGHIDVGVRVEIPAEIYAPITDVIYDPKFKYITPSHGDKVRTFCTNPNGRVRKERGGRIINGDALKKKKTKNTNFAILYTLNLTEPIADTKDFGKELIRMSHLAGGGKPIVQRLGDLLRGNRSKLETFFDSKKGYDTLEPTLRVPKQVVPADISLAYVGRVMDNIKDMIVVLDRIVEGVANHSTLIYAPEVKFYDTKYETSRKLETNIENLYVAGDGCGKSRGIIGAALTGILAAEGIKEKL